MDPVELVAALISAIAVWLMAVRHRLCWPAGLVSVIVYAGVFVNARLYSDALLQGVFAALLVYGWWHWMHSPGAGAAQLVVRSGSPREYAIPLVLAALGAAALGAGMARFTDAALPWLDAALTALSLVAQFWMSRRLRANWLMWIGVDVVYTGVYVVKDLPVTAVLYVAFIVLAVLGWRRWGAGAHAPALTAALTRERESVQ